MFGFCVSSFEASRGLLPPRIRSAPPSRREPFWEQSCFSNTSTNFNLLQFPKTSQKLLHRTKWVLIFRHTNEYVKTNMKTDVRVLLVLRTLCEEHMRREPRGRQRKLAFFSARVLYAAQNDVKFLQTNSAKVLIQLFQKLAGCGAAPHEPPKFQKNANFYAKPFDFFAIWCIIE